MNFIFSAVFAYFSFKLMTVYGSVVEGVAEPGAWVIFLGLLWLSSYLEPAKQFKKVKDKKDAEIKHLRQENSALKKLLQEKENTKEVEKEFNFFKKPD